MERIYGETFDLFDHVLSISCEVGREIEFTLQNLLSGLLSVPCGERRLYEIKKENLFLNISTFTANKKPP